MVSDQQRQLLLHLMSKEMAVKKGVVTYQQFKSNTINCTAYISLFIYLEYAAFRILY